MLYDGSITDWRISPGLDSGTQARGYFRWGWKSDLCQILTLLLIKIIIFIQNHVSIIAILRSIGMLQQMNIGKYSQKRHLCPNRVNKTSGYRCQSWISSCNGIWRSKKSNWTFELEFCYRCKYGNRINGTFIQQCW